jgi:hypothetical protein
MSTQFPNSVAGRIRLKDLFDPDVHKVAYNTNFIELNSVEPSLGIPNSATYTVPNSTYYFPVVAVANTYGDSRKFTNYSDSLAFFNGNLGVGTSTPNEKLTVVGNISATGRIYVKDQPYSLIFESNSIIPTRGNNTSSGYFGVVNGGTLNKSLGLANTIGGGNFNTTLSSYATIGGGFYNIAYNNLATIAGGTFNIICGNASTIGGGGHNVIFGSSSTIAGGSYNIATGNYALIGGGFNNINSGNYAVVNGGFINTAQGIYSVVNGGIRNKALGNYSTSSGYYNTASGDYSIIAGGKNNSANCSFSNINGGFGNSNSGNYSVIAGGKSNNVRVGDYSVISGGFGNTTSGTYASVGGGLGNEASDCSVVGGGMSNAVIGTGGFIGGGASNCVCANTLFSGILAGNGNVVQHTNSFAIGSNIVTTSDNVTYVNNLLSEGATYTAQIYLTDSPVQSFSQPVTASGQFLILNINGVNKAIRLWDFVA